MSNTTLFCQPYSIEHLKSSYTQEGTLARLKSNRMEYQTVRCLPRLLLKSINDSAKLHAVLKRVMINGEGVHLNNSRHYKSHRIENFEISPHRKLTYSTPIWTSTTNSFRSSDNLCSWKTFPEKIHTLYFIQARNEDHDCFMVNEMICTHRTRMCCGILGKLLKWNWPIPRRHREKTSYSKRTPVNWEIGKGDLD